MVGCKIDTGNKGYLNFREVNPRPMCLESLHELFLRTLDCRGLHKCNYNKFKCLPISLMEVLIRTDYCHFEFKYFYIQFYKFYRNYSGRQKFFKNFSNIICRAGNISLS